MTTTAFSYCILRYHHDPSTGEAVNVGVLVFAPAIGWVRFKGTTRTHALSTLFRGFDRDVFTRFINNLEGATQRLQNLLDNSRTQLPLFDDAPWSQNTGTLFFLASPSPSQSQQATVEAVARWLLPDNGLSFQFGEARGGITRDVLNTFHSLFDRLIVQQRPPQKERKRRDNEDVWSVFHSVLRQYGIPKHLVSHTVQVPQFDDPIPFRHAYKNEKWHAIEAMSFDYADSSSIREKALLWYGYGAALKQDETFSRLYILLGAPQESSQKKDYAGAKSWLKRMENRPQLVEEDEAPDFAKDLADTMVKEGVLKKAIVEDEGSSSLQNQIGISIS